MIVEAYMQRETGGSIELGQWGEQHDGVRFMGDYLHEELAMIARLYHVNGEGGLPWYLASVIRVTYYHPLPFIKVIK